MSFCFIISSCVHYFLLSLIFGILHIINSFFTVFDLKEQKLFSFTSQCLLQYLYLQPLWWHDLLRVPQWSGHRGIGHRTRD